MIKMPPKVARTGGGSKTQPPKKTTTSSSSKSSGSSKTSSSSSVKKTTPPVTSKPKNVDKVDFGKPKPTASAGTYKPTPPKQPSKAEEIARIAAEKRAESLAEMPSLVRKANEAFENWQKAVDDVRMCQHDLTRAQKKAEEIILGVNLNMALENQDIDSKEAIDDMAADFIYKNTKRIWD